MQSRLNVPWIVLLIAGASGTGKSTIARQIGQKFGLPWYQVDDLRLALQWMEVSLPAGTEALHYFAHIGEKQHIWKSSPESLRDMLIAVGEVMKPAIAAVVDNHVSQNIPIVIEGDGALPSLLHHHQMQTHVTSGALRMVVVAESSEASLLSNMRTRNRRMQNMADENIMTEARAKWLFSEWLEDEASRQNVPVVGSRPWDSALQRVLTAAARAG